MVCRTPSDASSRTLRDRAARLWSPARIRAFRDPARYTMRNRRERRRRGTMLGVADNPSFATCELKPGYAIVICSGGILDPQLERVLDEQPWRSCWGRPRTGQDLADNSRRVAGIGRPLRDDVAIMA